MKSVLLIVIVISVSCAPTKDAPPTGRIYDEARILSTDEEIKIYELINSVENNIGSQIAVQTVETLAGREMSDVSWEKMQILNLGREKEADGLLIFVALNEKEVAIEVGFGLDKIITHDVKSKIIRGVILPRFNEQNYGQGLEEGVTKIVELINTNKEMVGKRY